MKWIILLIIVVLAGVGIDYAKTPEDTVKLAETVVTDYPYIYPTTTPEQLLELVNNERIARGVKPLVVDPRLEQSATMKIDELLIEGWDSDPHSSDSGKHGYEYAQELWPTCNQTGENLLDGHMDAQKGFDWWMNSTPHREAMLNPKYDYTGIAVKDYYVVQHFCNIE